MSDRKPAGDDERFGRAGENAEDGAERAGARPAAGRIAGWRRGARVERAPPSSGEVPLALAREVAPGSTGRWAWLPLVAAAFVAVVVGGSGVAARFVSQRSSPSDTQERLRRAERLRDDATSACSSRRFDACEASLDEAARLDPAGESSDRVRLARAALQSARAP